jgi:hypothetical protein
VFVIFDTRAVFVFCPAVPFSIKAARFHRHRFGATSVRRPRVTGTGRTV